MTRDKAYALAGAVADAGFSTRISIGVHSRVTAGEHCSVAVLAMRVDSSDLGRLVTLGDHHGCDLNFVSGDGLTYFERLVVA